MNFKEQYNLIKDDIINTRRKIHQNPELGFCEFETADTICKMLDKYNIKYTNKIAKTGVVAQIGKGEDKVLLIRADMDALPVQEKTKLEFSSVNSGIMHACGHDIHIASALSAAIILKNYEDVLNGSVKIVFQPAEETTGGALPMIDEKILENPKVTAAIGGHVNAEYEVGTFKIKAGALMASPDDFSVKFIGKSTHGAEPENGISPIIPACEFVNKLKKAHKKLCANNQNVMSVCTINSNGGVNTIPDEALILGTFRSFDECSRKTACGLLEKYAEKIARKHGAKAEFNYNFLYPPLINDAELVSDFVIVANELFGQDSVTLLKKPFMTGDDFSYFTREIPSVYFWYGAKKEKTTPLHSSQFDANEDAIEVCANVFTEFALRYLGCDDAK